MIILTIKTDNPEAEIGIYGNTEQLAYRTWVANRQLAETIHTVIKELLDSQGKSVHDLEGVAVFKGPGSFTGLRIGISVANALAVSKKIPIVGSCGDDWIQTATTKLESGADDHIVLPEYGALPNITKPTK